MIPLVTLVAFNTYLQVICLRKDKPAKASRDVVVQRLRQAVTQLLQVIPLFIAFERMYFYIIKFRTVLNFRTVHDSKRLQCAFKYTRIF